MAAPEALDSRRGGADGDSRSGNVSDRLLNLLDVKGGVGRIGHPHPTGCRAGDHGQRPREPGGTAEGVDDPVEPIQVAIGLVTPDDGGGMCAVERVSPIEPRRAGG